MISNIAELHIQDDNNIYKVIGIDEIIGLQNPFKVNYTHKLNVNIIYNKNILRYFNSIIYEMGIKYNLYITNYNKEYFGCYLKRYEIIDSRFIKLEFSYDGFYDVESNPQWMIIERRDSIIDSLLKE